MRDGQTRQKLHRLCFAAGLLAVLLIGVPYLILGQDAIVTYHDQLDGEVIAYLLQAKHLFQGDMLPEFLNGVSKTALIPPAPACVLLFLPGNSLAALALMQVSGSVCGYAGMYLLTRGRTGNVYLSAAVGVLYGYLPFLPVYGLAQYGLPLLLYLLLEAREGRRRRLCLGYSVLYALHSSLVLVGFAVLGVLSVWALADRKGRKSFLQNLGVMLAVYLLENVRLLAQILGIGVAGEQISHKTEYVLFPETFGQAFWRGLLQGGQHSGDYHEIFVGAGFLVWSICGIWLLIRRGRQGAENAGPDQTGRLFRIMTICGGWNVFFAAAAALWSCEAGVYVRRQLQVIGAFQLDRVLWLAPCLWYLFFACALALAVEFLTQSKGKRKWPAAVLGIAMAAVWCVTGMAVLLGSNLKPNLQRLRNPDYGAISFRDYYAVGVYSQVEEFLWDLTGEPKEAYRVVSLGIDPAAALYHGFYCLDGYSNNYPLSYKHDFRRIIAPELAKNGYLTENFDGWGNRCYLFSAECPGYYTIEKGGFYFQDYTLDVDALKEMGGKYLFSAAYIMNGEERGLTLLREEPFATEDSYYQIYVYGF